MLLSKGLCSKEFEKKKKDNTQQVWVWNLRTHMTLRYYFSVVLLCEDIMILISLSYQK